MKFGKFAHAFAPIVAVALAAGLAGCENATVKINGEEGQPLSDLDLSGAPPQKLVLFGPDEVRVTPGDKLAIRVEGDAATTDALRFTLKDGTLGILRKDKLFTDGDRTAVIAVTMPAPRTVTMAGSGRIVAPTLASAAKVHILGSGTIEATALTGDSLDLTIAGSGNFRAAGKVRALKLSIAGSGSAAMGALRIETAKLSIAGSGNAAFASDGAVNASIMGSGEVRVTGRARCTVSALGSGKLVCEAGTEPTAPPQSPGAPDTP